VKLSMAVGQIGTKVTLPQSLPIIICCS
jgi:hypothetical protein